MPPTSDFETRSEAHRRSLTGYLYAVSGDYHLAEDMVQETLTTAYRKREHYFPQADFGAWLRAIARNVWLRERRAAGRRPRPSSAIEEMADDLFPARLYAEGPWQREREALADCLEGLAPEDRGLVGGHFASGLRYEELARRASRTLAWVKARMFRARRALADCVRRKLRLAED